MKKILIIDSNLEYSNILKLFLENNYFSVKITNGVQKGLDLISKENFELIVCDFKLNLISGIQLIETLKTIDANLKFIILSSSDSDEDELSCLTVDIGEYIRKEVSFKVILERIKRVIQSESNEVIKEIEEKKENLYINIEKREVIKLGKIINLTILEFDLLIYLIRNKNKVIDRITILKDVWGHEESQFDLRTVDTFIKLIRMKLNLRSIDTVRGVGYRWNDTKELV